MLTDRTVPFFSGAVSLHRDRDILASLVRDIATSGRFVNAATVAELEQAVMAYTGARHAVACNSASDALILMLTAAGIGPGDEVIVPAYTFFATASSVVHAGAEPVFADVLPDSYALDPESVRNAIGPRTKAIVAVHLFHQTADLHALRTLADEHGLDFFEDSAEAIGMRAGGRHAGLWGRAGVLSFFPTKTLGALGDGGMLITDDEQLARQALRLRQDVPLDAAEPSAVACLDSGCDELQAAVLLTRLRTLDTDIARRAELAERYTARLAPLAPLVTTPVRAHAHEPSNLVWYVYLIETERRDELARFLADNGVGTEIYYPRTLAEQPCFRSLPGARLPVPVADAAARRAIALPLYPDLTEAQVDRVCDLLHEFHGEAR
ncbi:DegT/DnrJ/EryC1/StrS family aminotransferase [Streptomyces monashensis]|uniref:Aminotransferase DegT n=1 Tax=Streptomyces monashensis TaxID=1678012 RepID=A0A1S2QNP1_9ACTN|nr:DegT/DnrJ/EryC1/StrS family aminotransferase [Streptomyces monashensis]OIK07780.1 aminotransferase DegT [Streptomyces monashensis]